MRAMRFFATRTVYVPGASRIRYDPFAVVTTDVAAPCVLVKTSVMPAAGFVQDSPARQTGCAGEITAVPKSPAIAAATTAGIGAYFDGSKPCFLPWPLMIALTAFSRLPGILPPARFCRSNRRFDTFGEPRPVARS